jgi:hypothetical protein
VSAPGFAVCLEVDEEDTETLAAKELRSTDHRRSVAANRMEEEHDARSRAARREPTMHGVGRSAGDAYDFGIEIRRWRADGGSRGAAKQPTNRESAADRQRDDGRCDRRDPSPREAHSLSVEKT